MRNIQRSVIATGLATILLAVGGTSIAVAENKSLIDTSKDGSASLTIHKRFVDATTAPNGPNPGGNQMDPEPANAADAADKTAKFKICKIADSVDGTSYDVKTFTGFKNAAKLKVKDVLDASGDIKANYKDTSYGACDTEETTAAGTGLITKNNLKLGVYLVRETVPAPGFASSAPFLVVLPTAAPETENGQNTKWNYDVHVYPKNSKFEVTKTVSTPSADQSNELSYFILSNIPKNTASEAITYFAIFDKLDSRVTYKNNSVAVALMPIATTPAEAESGNVAGSETLTVDTDFKVYKEEIISSSPKQTQMKIILTKEGLKKLQGKGNTHKVATKLIVEVDKKAAGVVTNGDPDKTPASVKYKVEPKTNNPGSEDGIPDNPENETDPKPPVIDVPVNNPDDDRPKTKYVAIKFKKVADENDPATSDVDETEGLAGAEFELHVCKVPTQDADTLTSGMTSEKLTPHKKFSIDPSAATTLEEKQMHIDEDGKWVNGAHTGGNAKTLTIGKGESVFFGVNANAKLAEDDDNDNSYVFCMVETKAPEGYDLLPYPVFVTKTLTNLEESDLFTFNMANTDGSYVKNLKSTSFNLPNTGGAGVIAFGVIGGGLALYGLFAARRRKDEEEA